MSDNGDGLMGSIKQFTGFGNSIFNSSSAVGVDVGSRSVKTVVLERKKEKLILKNYAIAKAKQDLIKAGTSGVINPAAGDLVKKVIEKADVDEEKVNVSVPSFSSLVTTIEIPKMPKDEIEQVIQVEAPKYIPVQLSDVVYGWQIVDSPEQSVDPESKNKDSSSGQIRVMVVAIMKDISSQYEKVFEKNDLTVDSLEIDSFSLTRALASESQECNVILDIGHKVTNILIVSGGNILVNRTIDVAGERITKAIARGMNIGEGRAEQYKIENGIGRGGQDGGVVTQMLDVLISEAMQTIDNFKDDYRGKEPENILLSGGGAYMRGLQGYVERSTKINTKIGNPIEGITYPDKYKKTVLNHGPLLSVAVGLAKLSFDEKS